MSRPSLSALSALFLAATLSIATPSQAIDTQAESRLQSIRDTLAAEQDAKPPDTVFQFNTGLSVPQKGAEVLFGTDGAMRSRVKKHFPAGAEPIADKTLDDFLDAHYDKIDQNLKGKVSLEQKRRQVLEKTTRKHQAYEKMEEALLKDEALSSRKLEQLGDQRLKVKGIEQQRVKKELTRQAKVNARAQLDRRVVQRRKANIGVARQTAQMQKLNKEIIEAQSKFDNWTRARARKHSFDKGGFILGLALTAISSEMEENAQAAAEGRRPSMTNKLGNFVKNVSGYSTVMGVMENVEMAKVESFLDTMDFYQRNGIELTPAEMKQRLEAAANRAVVRAAIYEGAKLAPVISDLITIKETADVALETAVAIEESGYIQAGNEEAQYQTSLRGAVNLEAKVRQMEAVAERSKLIISSLGKLKNQLLAMEQHAETNRARVREALNLVETYNAQAEAMRNPAAAAIFEPASIDALLDRLKTVRANADEQSGNMQRVKSEHQSGKLTAQAVATQARFIGDLLQPSLADFSSLQPTLDQIEAVGRGSELAAQIPGILEFLGQAKVTMQQQGDRSGQLYELYREQASTLEQCDRQFRELRAEMPRYLEYVKTGKNLEEVHRDKIRAALDRANNVDIDQTALRRAIDDARGLRSSTDMVSALAGLDKLPKVVDTSQIDALVQQAQQAWQKLSGPEKSAAESLQKAQSLLNELVALAGDAKPVEMENAEKKIVKPASNLAGKLFGGTSWQDLSVEYMKLSLENLTKDRKYVHKEFFGFQTFDFPPGTTKEYEYCRTVTDRYCPDYGEMYRILEQGENRWTWNSSSGKSPYWIAYKLKAGGESFTSDYSPIPKLADHYQLERSLKNAKEKNELVEARPISIPHADEAMVLITGNGWRRVEVHARSGPFYLWRSGELDCVIGPIEASPDKNKRELDPREAVNPAPYTKDTFDKDFADNCASWYNAEPEILAELVSPLMAEINPILEQTRKNFYLKPIRFDLKMPGFTLRKTDKEIELTASQWVNNELSRKWEIPVAKRKESLMESYGYNISMQTLYNRNAESWQAITDRIDADIDKKHGDQLKRSGYQEVKVAIPGAEHVKMSRNYSRFSRKGEAFVEHNYVEELHFRIQNIQVRVYSRVENDSPETRTVDVGKAIAQKILSSPKGWD